jgi:translation initiation factor IF-3
VPVPRRFDRRPPERDTTRINERIRVSQVRLIGAEGEQLGVVEIAEALKRAQDADLDLVEVAPNSKPPVTRLLDYSKYKYEQEQKQKAARKHQQQVNVREIKLRPKIATHDYETKKGHVERFLRQHNKVKITIMFRGREQAHPERGRMLLKRLFDDLGELAVIESEPLQEGRNMSMLLAAGKAVDRVQPDGAGESQSATDDAKPPVEEVKPAEDEAKPATGKTKVPDAKPKASKAKPKASEGESADEADEPGEDVAAASG